MDRLCIHPKDVCRLLGFSERHARLILKKILLYFNKQPHQLVTIHEFSQYFGLDPHEVRQRLH